MMHISEDQLAIDWTLTTPDRTFAQNNTRGQDQRISCVIDLCHLRAHARFMDKNEELPINALHYLARQLDYEPPTSVPVLSRQNTTSAMRQKIIDYLGFCPLDQQKQENLKTWLISQMYAQIHDRKVLMIEAKDYLRTNKIILPAPTQLGRLLTKTTKDALEELYVHIVQAFPILKLPTLDQFLEPSNELFAHLTDFKRYPANPNAQELCEYLDYFEQLDQLAILDIDLSKISPDVITYLSQMGRYYNVADLKKMGMAKRYAIMICFLYENAKNILDLLVKMHSELLTTIQRKARNEVNEERLKWTGQAKGKLKDAAHFIREAMDTKHHNLQLPDFIKMFNSTALLKSAELCEAMETLESAGLAEHIMNRFMYLRRYTKRFLLLDFEAAKGVKPLLKGIEMLRQVHNGEIKQLPDTVPVGFLPKMWKDVLYDEEGKIKPDYWEMGTYYALKKQMAAGNLFLSKSEHHQYFWDTVYKEEEWAKDRDTKYADLKLPSTFAPLATKLEHQFDEMATLFSKSYGPFSFANIVKSKLVLLKDDALFIPPDVKKLRHLIQAQMPPTRIEKVLAESDHLSGFSKAFIPFHDEYRDTELPKKSIYAAIIGHATNMGLYGMGHCATGVSTEMIKTASQEYLRTETVTNASSTIIKQHLQYPISKAFGDKSWSGSDAERFGIQASSLLGSCYPRFFGYYDQAISIYTHIADTFDVFSTQVISCSEREATYVLTGLLAADKSDIHPQFHCTDTHGFTEHVFALSYLLGFSFCPRLKDLKEQRLYKISKDKNYGPLEPLFSGVINMKLIHDNWDQIVRIIAALRNGHIPAHVIVQKLANRLIMLLKPYRNWDAL